MSLKQLARIIANCPEDNNCVDRKEHPTGGYLETMKSILPPGKYVMDGWDYINNKNYGGTLIVNHEENSLQLESNINVMGSQHVQVRMQGKISGDSTKRAYYTSTTNMVHSAGYRAEKRMKCVSKHGNSVTLLGYGSSTLTEKYHCGTNIKKVCKKTGTNSFRIDTYLNGQRAYGCDYKQ